MAKCDICNKEIAFGIKVSHSHRRSNRTWKPNVKKVKAIVNGSPRRINVCTRCLRSGRLQEQSDCYLLSVKSRVAVSISGLLVF